MADTSYLAISDQLTLAELRYRTEINDSDQAKNLFLT